MKRYFALVLAVSLAVVLGARAQGLDEQYVQIFNLIQEADALGSSESAQALAKYMQAQTALQRLQKGSPDWNANIVNFRLNYVASKIASLSTNAPAAISARDTNATAGLNGTNTPSAGVPPAAPADWEAQLNMLKDQVRQLQAERLVMDAKLKEALAAQPSQVDPRELARAEERIKALQKENELLKVTAGGAKSNAVPVPDGKAPEQTQKALVDATRQLVEQQELISRLTGEQAALQAKLKSNSSSGDAAAMKAENELLKKKLASLQSAPSAGARSNDAALQTQIAALRSDKEMLQLEKTALENRIKQFATAAGGTNMLTALAVSDQAMGTKQPESSAALEKENELKKSAAAGKPAAGKKGKNSVVRTEDLELELVTARARLAVLEAQRVPYSAEELALLKRPETMLAAAEPNPAAKKPSKELPPGSRQLVADAQRYFSNHQYDKAEANYGEVLKQDPKNITALANLAAVQIEAGHLDAAETNIRTALTEDPEDGFSLYILGILKFRQTNYDASLDALSRAAKVDPDNPEVQNYLGLALSEKGMRIPAETAMRKAIQLQPNYGGAHYNLAIIYLNQQPPATELARWHYQKALSLGHARSPELEKKFEAKPSSPSVSQSLSQ